MNTIRVLISLAAHLNWPLKQFDVKNVFLHGHLEEEVYMDFPSGIMPKGKPEYVGCKSRFMDLSNHLLHGLVDLLKL